LEKYLIYLSYVFIVLKLPKKRDRFTVSSSFYITLKWLTIFCCSCQFASRWIAWTRYRVDNTGCNAHIVHNCARNAIDLLPIDVESFVSKIFGYFSSSSSCFLFIDGVQKPCLSPVCRFHIHTEGAGYTLIWPEAWDEAPTVIPLYGLVWRYSILLLLK